jgi:hypothetical protein
MRCALPVLIHPSTVHGSTQPHPQPQPHPRSPTPARNGASSIHPSPLRGDAQVHASPVHRDHHPTWGPRPDRATVQSCTARYVLPDPGPVLSLPLLMTGGPGAGGSGQGGSLGAIRRGSAWAGDRDGPDGPRPGWPARLSVLSPSVAARPHERRRCLAVDSWTVTPRLLTVITESNGARERRNRSPRLSLSAESQKKKRLSLSAARSAAGFTLGIRG